jgi:flagella basal body P-ring formation protein FlgA
MLPDKPFAEHFAEVTAMRRAFRAQVKESRLKKKFGALSGKEDRALCALLVENIREQSYKTMVQYLKENPLESMVLNTVLKEDRYIGASDIEEKTGKAISEPHLRRIVGTVSQIHMGRDRPLASDMFYDSKRRANERIIKVQVPDKKKSYMQSVICNARTPG